MNIARFAKFMDKVLPEPNSGCWLWAASVDGRGYGQFKLEGLPRNERAHRAAYEHFVGPIPEGLVVCHKCDVKTCVNPEHMFLGTIADNNRDCVAKERNQRGDKHGCAKLTKDTISAIRSSLERNVTLARTYGVSEATISNIRLRKSWRHVA